MKWRYRAIHTAVATVWGKASRCELKGCKDAKRYEWSNKDHKYSLERQDWWQLCSKCHWAYDRENFGKIVWNRGRIGKQKNHNTSGLLREPWNKGKKTGIVPRSAFKKGNVPHNKPLIENNLIKL